jgi:hypothetical protein
MIIKFEEIDVFSEDGLVKVNLEWIGEGISEDYNQDDPDDIPLLRYAVYRKFTKDCKNKAERLSSDFRGFNIGEWMEVDDSSYCTQLSALENRDLLIEAAQFILAYVQSGVRDFNHEKRLYELLSWVGIKDGVPYCEQSIVISAKG